MTIVRRLTLIIIFSLLIHGCSHSSDDSTEVDAFISTMVPHHRLGLAMLDHAVPRVNDVRVRRLVFEMSGYHDDELHLLEGHLTHGDEATTFPGWIAPERLTELDERNGPEYDTVWLSLMIEHHEGAIVIATNEISRIVRDSDQARYDLALRIIATQQAEIAKMKGLLNSMFIEQRLAAERFTTECGGCE